MSEASFNFNENNWVKIKKNLKDTVGSTNYNNWLKQVSFLSVESDIVSLSVPTKFLRDWIVNNYADKIKIECKKINENISSIKILVKPVGGRIVPGTARELKSDNKQLNNSLDIRNSNYQNNSDLVHHRSKIYF